MSLETPRQFTLEEFERAADEYEASETIFDIMESVPHSQQKDITVDSFTTLHRFYPELQVFSELLVQDQVGGEIVQAVPDNCVALHARVQENRRSYNVPYEGRGIFWAIEYVSPSARDRRKDYDECFQKYSEMKVPYVLHFEPVKKQLEMYRHDGLGYEELSRNSRGRYEVPELDLEVGLLDGWVRYWHRGELLRCVKESEQRILEQDSQLSEKDALLGEKDARVNQLQAELSEKDKIIQASQDDLRQRIERAARRNNRQDILAGLSTASPSQLNEWLDELLG